MKIWTEYQAPIENLKGKRKKYDTNIYTFDIETSSYLILNNKIIPACKYLDLNKKEQEDCEYHSCMYIWQFGINDTIYYGRTWEEFKQFLKMLDNDIPYQKFVFVHNLAFEFQYLKSQFHFEEVTARKSHKVMTCIMRDYNIMFRCSYYMSNVALKELPKMYKLPVEKKVGDLDYDKIRHSDTILTDTELGYCEYDCLVVYYYILEELKTYEDVKKIPTTSTGHVRRELKDIVMKDYSYRAKVNKAINTDPHVYNLLVQAFMGGYTHSNWVFTDTLLKNIDSYDISSSYPYTLVCFKFPSTEFRKMNLKKIEYLDKRFAYLMVVRFTNLKCKYYNNFISASRCRNIRGAKYDNGRIMSAESLEITLTDVDFYFIKDTYDCNIEILECYYSLYNFLPKQFIEFVLQKYVNKTEFKGVPEKELQYQKEKNKFNALFGMSVTNEIRSNVIYNDDTLEWSEEDLTNDEIIEKLLNQKKQSFLSFAYGTWVTAWARNNLLRRVIELDDYVVYCDTDSCKLVQGYNKEVFTKYNESVIENIKSVANYFNIDVNKFMPKDIKGKSRPLGVFESETEENSLYTYEEFITQGAKKYAYKQNGKIHITVAGVPKCGSEALKDLNNFRDNFVFEHKYTHKNLLIYVENQGEYELTDYQGRKLVVNDKAGCCIIPTTYVLSKALEYANLISDESSKRAIYKE